MKRKHTGMEKFSEICVGDKIFFYSNDVNMAKRSTVEQVVSRSYLPFSFTCKEKLSRNLFQKFVMKTLLENFLITYKL